MISEIRKELKELYEIYIKKYKLEELEVLEQEFGFYLTKRGHPIYLIIKFLDEKLDSFKSFLMIFIEPRGLINNFESKMLKDNFKEKILEKYKLLMALEWKSLRYLEKGEKYKIIYLKEMIKLIREIRPFMILLSEKMSNNWLKKNKKEKKNKNIFTY